ncbi:pirin family protein [Hyphomonas sp. WL0036]|uniref:pirin family protein n=1 Tax=Hyphomonas sediminis TaxID=2866160 RepID=UPI001C80AA50|nr:pirin family protein [Hyphomonas sediminis]MBY9068304.1 pirin family protein [Hyphomonas sediminis]
MIELIIDKRTRDLGGGFEVGRVLPFAKRRMVGPFIFFDQMGPVDFAAGIPRELDVRPHPHIGLSTVTYLYSGAMTHRDSLGFKQEIQPGAVNWMTAGKGITHSERLEYARMHGAHMHGIQAWVALPKEEEEIDPGFWHHPADSLPVWTEPGLKGRLIAGSAEGLDAGVNVRSPMFYMHWEMEAGARRKVPDAHAERAVYVANGVAQVAGQKLGAGQMAVLGKGDAVVTAEETSTVMVLGGEPIGERFIFWNFVSSSRERLEQAKEDWKQGRMKLPDGDDQEFTPLPES